MSGTAGTRIRSLAQLVDASDDKRAVTCPNYHNWKGPRPAAVMVNLSGAILHKLINNGMYIYEKTRKGKIS